MTFPRSLQKIAVAMAMVASLGAASPALADITASATSSGSASAYTLVTRITPDAQYLGRGKLYFVMLHGSQIYVLSETRGFLPYTGGEPVEYRTITRASETITVQGWNTTAQAGASIFVGFGSDVMDMLNNGKFKLVATLPSAPVPPPNIQYAAYSGTYMCFDDHGRSGSVTATFTASRAVVDTTQLSAIPDYSYDLPINNLDYEPDMLLYRTETYPVRGVGLSLVRTSSPYTMAIGYQASRSSTEIVYGCTKQ